MEYEKIILNLIERVSILEEKVAELEAILEKIPEDKKYIGQKLIDELIFMDDTLVTFVCLCCLCYLCSFPGGLDGKASVCNAGDLG